MSEQYKPFPEIPVDKDYEIDTSQKVTGQNSSFFTNFEKRLMANKNLLDLAESGGVTFPDEDTSTSEKALILLSNALILPESIIDLETYIRSNYPSSYYEVKNALGNFHPSRNSSLLGRFSMLQERLTSEYNPPSHLRVRVGFRDHTIPTTKEYEEIKVAFKDDVKAGLSKDASNIFLAEDMEGIMNKSGNFRSGFKKYGSFRKATSVLILKRQHTEEELEELVEARAQQARKAGGELGYSWMEQEVVDELMDEGFKIRVIFENGVRLKDAERRVIQTPVYTAEDGKRYAQVVFPYIVRREKELIKQVGEVEAHAKGPTNIYIALGSNHHATLPHHWPLRFSPVTIMASPVGSGELFSNAEKELLKAFVLNEKTPKELLDAVYPH